MTVLVYRMAYWVSTSTTPLANVCVADETGVVASIDRTAFPRYAFALSLRPLSYVSDENIVESADVACSINGFMSGLANASCARSTRAGGFPKRRRAVSFCARNFTNKNDAFACLLVIETPYAQ